MKSRITGVLVLLALVLIGLGFVVLGNALFHGFAHRDYLRTLFVVATGLGTVLAFIKNIGGIFPPLVAFMVILRMYGLFEAAISISMSGIILWFALRESEQQLFQKNYLLLYEWLGSLFLSIYTYMVLRNATGLLPQSYIPLLFGTTAGIYSIAGNLFKSVSLSEKQIRKMILFLSIGGMFIGLILGRVFRRTFIPS